MKKMNRTSRIIIAIASLSLIATFFLPVWFIYLLAPQYPEGLTMQIWLTTISGDVEIINGLNHYIGMKHISVDMFPEFGYLRYIVLFFIAFGLLIAITGSRRLLFSYLVLTAIGGAAALYDFYSWGYDYGHNLDPTAAIQVPGLSYQPPVVGHKTLLNFDAYSYPDTGGWVVIIVSLVFGAVWYMEWRKSRRSKAGVSKVMSRKATAAAVMLVLLASCSTDPKPFVYGSDICGECSMMIMDAKFGAQIISRKGKVFKFDDAHCVASFLKSGKLDEKEVSRIVFIDYNRENSFIDAGDASFVHAEEINSPMNSNIAAFSSEPEAGEKKQQVNGTLLSWKEVLSKL